MSATPSSYPVALEIAPPESQSRLTVFFRPFMIIPHAVILYFINIAAELVVVFGWFSIVFAARFPAGLWNFVAGYLRWSTRVNAYTLLLTGRYPPFALDDDPMYPVRLLIEERTTGRNRITTFFRLILVIPHVIVLYFLGLAAGVAVFLAWLVALVTGRVPESLHGFVAGVLRWNTRVNAYFCLLVDDYPPFSLD